MADSQTRHSRGLIVVVALAVLFFTLLGLIVLKSGDESRKSEKSVSETLTVLPVRIRVRTEPHARAPVVATATTGERLTLLEDRGAWVRVQNSEGLAGWAERANLERVTEQQRRARRYEAIRKLPPLKGVSTERAQLYAGPGIFYPMVGELAGGSNVTIYTRDHDFFAVAHKEGVAYVDVDSVDISASGTHQLDVQTSSASATMPDEVPETPTDTMASAEPPPLTEPEPVPVPEPVERSTGVYSAVPPGGTQPEELDRVIPRYPTSARRAGVQGAVVVRGIVRRDGTIDNVEILKDLPHGLGQEAVRAVRRWRFRPATFQGEPIDVYYTVTVNFRLQ